MNIDTLVNALELVMLSMHSASYSDPLFAFSVAALLYRDISF